jgi:hypothetical protein
MASAGPASVKPASGVEGSRLAAGEGAGNGAGATRGAPEAAGVGIDRGGKVAVGSGPKAISLVVRATQCPGASPPVLQSR